MSHHHSGSVRYTNHREHAHLIGAAIAIISVGAAIVLWSYIPRIIGANPVHFPPLSSVWSALVSLWDPGRDDYLAYYAFAQGRTIGVYFGTTLLTVSLGMIVGSIVGISLGIWGGSSPYARWTIVLWLIVYYGAIPRLLEILYISDLRIIGIMAGVVLSSLAVTFCTGLATIAALQDPSLEEGISQARLDAPNSLIVILCVVIPQKRHMLSVALLTGAVGAVSAVIFTEYVQSTTGLGYLLQIVFGNDPRIAEALAVSICVTAILLIWCGLIAILSGIWVRLWLMLARLALILSRPCRT